MMVFFLLIENLLLSIQFNIILIVFSTVQTTNQTPIIERRRRKSERNRIANWKEIDTFGYCFHRLFLYISLFAKMIFIISNVSSFFLVFFSHWFFFFHPSDFVICHIFLLFLLEWMDLWPIFSLFFFFCFCTFTYLLTQNKFIENGKRIFVVVVVHLSPLFSAHFFTRFWILNSHPYVFSSITNNNWMQKNWYFYLCTEYSLFSHFFLPSPKEMNEFNSVFSWTIWFCFCLIWNHRRFHQAQKHTL